MYFINMNKYLALIFYVFSLFGFNLNASEVQLARFQPWIEIVRESLISSTDLDKVVEALLSGNARIASFNVQALGKIYSSQDPLFKDIRSDFKKMEDAIGEYDKWDKILANALKKDQNSSDITKLRKRVKEARESFKAYLIKESWVVIKGKSKLDRIKDDLEQYKWDTVGQDRSHIIQTLREQLKSIYKTDYDMTVLEEGNGLHELRRELRWFLIESRVLNGAVTFKKSNSCPIGEYQDLLKDKTLVEGKYSKLPQDDIEESPCLISQCLFLAVVDDVGKLGDIKDKAEKINNKSGDTSSDIVPEELADAAQSIYDKINDTKLLRELSDELKSCQN